MLSLLESQPVNQSSIRRSPDRPGAGMNFLHASRIADQSVLELPSVWPGFRAGYPEALSTDQQANQQARLVSQTASSHLCPLPLHFPRQDAALVYVPVRMQPELYEVSRR